MARPHRLRIAGLSQHVIQRGNNRTPIFNRDEDFEVFLVMLADAAKRHRLEVHAYVLMTNHVHLLVTPRVPGAVPVTMQLLGSRYASYFNRRHQRTGTLFEGRYRATIIDSDAYWLACMRYVELNPVRAGIVARAESYCWSSYGTNALGLPDAVLTPHLVYLSLADTPEDRQRTWRQMCAENVDLNELQQLRAAAHRGRALGRIVIPAE